MRTFSRIVFLDIDGVLQPGSQDRFDYRREVGDLCRELEENCGGRYPYTQWCPSREICDMDLAAVYYDWDRDAVERLREDRRRHESAEKALELGRDDLEHRMKTFVRHSLIR